MTPLRKIKKEIRAFSCFWEKNDAPRWSLTKSQMLLQETIVQLACMSVCLKKVNPCCRFVRRGVIIIKLK